MNGPSAPTPGSAPPAQRKLPPRKALAFFAGLLLVNYLLMSMLFPGERPVTVPYTVFREQVAAGNVVALYSRGTAIEGRFKTAVTWPTPEEVKQAQQTPPRTSL